MAPAHVFDHAVYGHWHHETPSFPAREEQPQEESTDKVSSAAPGYLSIIVGGAPEVHRESRYPLEIWSTACFSSGVLYFPKHSHSFYVWFQSSLEPAYFWLITGILHMGVEIVYLLLRAPRAGLCEQTFEHARAKDAYASDDFGSAGLWMLGKAKVHIFPPISFLTS